MGGLAGAAAPTAQIATGRWSKPEAATGRIRRAEAGTGGARRQVDLEVVVPRTDSWQGTPVPPAVDDARTITGTAWRDRCSSG